MEYFRLPGVSSLTSRLTFGCEQLGGTDWGTFDLEETFRAVQSALDLGINCFDTADVYGLGLSETHLKRALGSKRHDQTIITKFGVRWDHVDGEARARTYLDASPSYLRKACEKSLSRLGIDVIPIYLLHWPDPNTPIEKTAEELIRLRDEGKVRHIGLSNPTIEQLNQLKKLSLPDVVQVRYSLIDTEVEANILPFCSEHKIPVFSYGSLAQGLLSGKYSPGKPIKFELNDRRSRLPHFQNFQCNTAVQNLLEVVTSISASEERTVAQVALGWVLANPAVSSIIVGIKNPNQILETASSMNHSLKPSSLKILELHASRKKADEKSQNE